MADKEITCEVKLVLRKEENKNNTELRIVSWNKKPNRLEKRGSWTKDGKTLPGKAEGMTADDVKCIIERQAEILEALK